MVAVPVVPVVVRNPNPLPLQPLPVSRKRPHPESDSKSKSSLHTFVLYLRQQYAFCPRWWYLFRFVLSLVQQAKDATPYVTVMRLLLAGHRKERRLLIGYLHLPCDESKEVSFDRCFDKSKHNAYLYRLLDFCEECLSLGVAKYESCRLQVRNDCARVDEDDADLYVRVKEARTRDMSLFSLFMNTFGDVDRRRIVRVLDFYSEQYLTYGYVDSNEVFESVYSSIYSISEAVKAFRNIMDSFFVC